MVLNAMERAAPDWASAADVAESCYRAVSERQVGDIRLFTFADIAAAEPAWRVLERRERVSLYQSYDWAATWARTVGIGQNENYRIFVGYRANNPVLLVAVAIDTTGRGRVARPIGGVHAGRSGPIVAKVLANSATGPLELADIGRAIRADTRADALILPYLTEDAARNEAADGGLVFAGTHADQTYLAHLAPWHVFEPAHRTDKQRRADARDARKLAKHGAVSFAIVDGRKERNDLLDTLFDWKSRQFAETGVADRFAEPAVRSFYKRLIDGKDGITPVLGVLRVGDRHAAIVFGVGYGTTNHGLVTAISPDRELRRGSPGFLAFEHYLKASCEAADFQRIDFGIGANAIKARWCDTAEPLHYRYEAFSPRGLMICLHATSKEIGRRVLKSHPDLAQRFYKLRQSRAMATATR